MKAFVSYSLKDAAFTASLWEELEKLGVTARHDFYGASQGSRGEIDLRKALEDSDAVILVVPQTGASQANTTFFEAGAARALGKRILAVMPDSKDRQAPTSIADFAIFDASKKPMEEVARTLVHALEAA